MEIAIMITIALIPIAFILGSWVASFSWTRYIAEKGMTTNGGKTPAYISGKFYYIIPEEEYVPLVMKTLQQQQ